MRAPDSLVLRPKSPEELFNALLNSDTTIECEKSHEDQSDSDDSKPEFDTDSKFNYLDKLLKTVSSPESDVLRYNFSEKQSTSFYASASISEYLQSDDDLSDSESSDLEHKFKPSGSEEVDLNKSPQDLPPEEFNSLNVTAPSSTCPSRAKAYKYWTFRSPPVKRSQLRNQPMQNSNSDASGSMRRKLPRPMNLLPRAAISSVSRSCSARFRSKIPSSSSGAKTTLRENLSWSPAFSRVEVFVFREKPGGALQVNEDISAQVVRGVFSLELLIMICCCIRFKINVSFTYQSSLTIISAVIGNFITVYSTSCPIHTI